MLSRPVCLGMALAAAIGFPVAQAATHEVHVEDFVVYDPDDISIAVGDTVRWINGPGGAFHDVTADDHSWASPVGRGGSTSAPSIRRAKSGTTALITTLTTPTVPITALSASRWKLKGLRSTPA